MELATVLNELFSQFFVFLPPEHKVLGRTSAAQGFCVPQMPIREQIKVSKSFYLNKGVLGVSRRWGVKGWGLAFLESDPVSAGPHQERLRLSMRGLEELGSHRDHGKNKMEKNLLKRSHVCGFLSLYRLYEEAGFLGGRRGSVRAGSVGPSCRWGNYEGALRFYRGKQ